MSEGPATIFTNDKADLQSKDLEVICRQADEAVSRSKQLRALGIKDSPPAYTLPPAAGTNSNQLTTPEKNKFCIEKPATISCSVTGKK